MRTARQFMDRNGSSGLSYADEAERRLPAGRQVGEKAAAFRSRVVHLTDPTGSSPGSDACGHRITGG